MNDDELRRAYAALRRERAQLPASNRPDPESIRAALDGELADAEREQVLEHALTSGAAADLAVLHAAHVASSVGLTSSRAATTRNRPSLARRWWPAAAAALVMVVGLPIAIRQPDSEAPTRFRAAVSAGAPQLVAPTTGTTLSAGQRFVWTTVAGTSSYTLELLDANGRTVTQASTKDTTLVLSSSVTAADRARTTGWWVTATAVDGRQQRSELRLTRGK